MISFKKISLNWITDLSVFMQNDQEFDNILTIVCCITKYILFIFTHKTFTVIEFAELFFEHIKCHFEISRSIIMNRDSHIILKFWQEICKIQMIKRHMFTVYHSQTDDQSEVLNHIMKDYLHVYNVKDQTVWTHLLFLAQFVYNNSQSFIINMSSNWLFFDFDCEIWINIMNNVSERRISVTRDHVEKLYQLHQWLWSWLIEAQECMTQYYNANHVSKQFLIESFVKLFTKHLKFKHYKLSSCWIELFRVLEWIDDQAYHLALSDKYVQLHDMFSIQLLEIYHCWDDDESLMTMSDLKDLQDEWEIEKVLNHWWIKNTVHYLIK